MVAPHSQQNARLLALEILLQILPGASSPKSLNHLLQSESADSALPPFTQVLAYGVCRYYQPLQKMIDKRLQKPLKAKDRDITVILLLGLYQILYTNKPAHAILNETTELARKRRKKWAAGLVNGVLRGVHRDFQAGKLPEISPESTFPDWLRQEIAHHYTPALAAEIFEHSLVPAPMSLRHNQQYQAKIDFAQSLSDHNITGRWSEITPSCFTLDQPCPVSEIPEFMQGSCSVQDEAAQWATYFLNPAPKMKVLDACAAPGGKTGHLLEWAQDLTMIALDVSPKRLESIESNLSRLQQTATLIAADAADTAHWWDGTPFDAILLDAPCSGTGVLRRHPDIFWLKHASDIGPLVKLQQRLIDALWQTLKPGGKLLYCTCSILPQENALQITRFLKTHTDATLEDLNNTPLAKSSKIAPPKKPEDLGLQILPRTNQHDGFYYALLTKRLDQ